MDIESIISKNIDGYLKPKYPIYKLYYIACWDCEGGGMETKKLVKLVEVLPIDKYNEDNLEFEDGFICNFILDCFDDNNIVEKDGVKILGETNILNKLPVSASNLFAKNVFNFISNLYDKENKKLNINLEDEIIEKTLIK